MYSLTFSLFSPSPVSIPAAVRAAIAVAGITPPIERVVGGETRAYGNGPGVAFVGSLPVSEISSAAKGTVQVNGLCSQYKIGYII